MLPSSHISETTALSEARLDTRYVQHTVWATTTIHILETVRRTWPRMTTTTGLYDYYGTYTPVWAGVATNAIRVQMASQHIYHTADGGTRQ